MASTFHTHGGRAAAIGDPPTDDGDPPAAVGEARLLAALSTGDVPAARALAVQLTRTSPRRGLAWKVHGALRWAEGDAAGALAAMQTSIRLLPQDAEAHVNLGLTLTKLGRIGEAEPYLERAIAIQPDFSIAHYRLGMAYFLSGRIDAALSSLRRGLAFRANYAEGEDAQNFSNLLFVMRHCPAVDAEELLAEHRRYGQTVEGPLRGAWPRHANERDGGRTLKIGFVSGDLYEHSVGQFLEPVVSRLARRPGLELHAYCTQPIEDALAARLRASFARWSPVDALADAPLAEKIQQDRIDVLIDLSGHTGHNRLPVFARKPAPVQVSWLGYPATTGLSAMDYYLADPLWLPPGRFEHQFTEQLVYLPDRWAFTPHAHAPPVGPLPALATGRLTFGSFHRLGKINPAAVALWSKLLSDLPESRLLILGVPVDGPDRALLAQFAAHGIDAERLTLHGRSTMDVYLAFHNQVDIALDTLPYSGATTTMHSLSMGVPTLTIAGQTSQARAAAGILGKVGLEAFIAADEADFLARARHWRQQLPALAALRQELRARLADSPAGQPDLIAAHLESALRHMWRGWCSNTPPRSFGTHTLQRTP